MITSEATRLIASAAGKQNSPDGRSKALDALRAAIRNWNNHQWEYRVARLTHTMAEGANELVIPDLHKVLTIRENTSGTAEGKTYFYKRYRDILSNTRNTSEAGLTNLYTVLESDDQNAKTIIFFQPFGEETEIQIIYYKSIPLPEQNDDPIVVPDQYINALLHGAKAMFLADIDAENPRLAYHAQEADRGLRAARKNDLDQPDDDIGLRSRYEHGGAYGDPDEDLI